MDASARSLWCALLLIFTVHSVRTNEIPAASVEQLPPGPPAASDARQLQMEEDEYAGPVDIVCAIMVKNEADALPRTLASVQCAVLFLLDTGSTDGTIQIARETASERGMAFQLLERPFVDFATSRNELLRFVRDTLSDVDSHDVWVMLIDANEVLHLHGQGEGLGNNLSERLRATTEIRELEGILIERQWIERDGQVESHLALPLVRVSALRHPTLAPDGYAYSGAVHEVLQTADGALGRTVMLQGVTLVQHRTAAERAKTRARYDWDARQLSLQLDAYADPCSRPAQRDVFLLGRVHFNLGRMRKARRTFERMLRCETAGEDLVRALDFLGRIEEVRGGLEAALSYRSKAFAHAPSTATSLSLGICHLMRGEWREAERSLIKARDLLHAHSGEGWGLRGQRELTVPAGGFEGSVYFHYAIALHNLRRSGAVGAARRADEAWDEARRARFGPGMRVIESQDARRFVVSRQADHAMRYALAEGEEEEEESRQPKRKSQASGAHASARKKDGAASESIRAEVGRGRGLRVHSIEDGSVTAIAAANASSILIYVGMSMPHPWVGDAARRGALGGSETNAAELAAALCRRGHSLTVSGHVGSGSYDGVNYVPEDELELSDEDGNPKFDHVVISRMLLQFSSRHALVARGGIFLWLQDVMPHMESPVVLPNAAGEGASRTDQAQSVVTAHLPTKSRALLSNLAPRLTRVLALSPWHASELSRRFPALHRTQPQLWGKWMPNAIDAELWAAVEAAHGDKRKIRRRFIYTSAPSRGLEALLNIFPQIREAIPGATLLVSTYDVNGITKKMRRKMKDMSGFVTFKGALGKEKLYHEILRSEVWLYPTSFMETYCNTALEMMMGRVLAVAPPVGALGDWLSEERGILIPLDENGRMRFDLQSLAMLLDDEPRLEAQLMRARKWAELQTWSARAQQWEEMFDEVN